MSSTPLFIPTFTSTTTTTVPSSSSSSTISTFISPTPSQSLHSHTTTPIASHKAFSEALVSKNPIVPASPALPLSSSVEAESERRRLLTLLKKSSLPSSIDRRRTVSRTSTSSSSTSMPLVTPFINYSGLHIPTHMQDVIATSSMNSLSSTPISSALNSPDSLHSFNFHTSASSSSLNSFSLAPSLDNSPALNPRTFRAASFDFSNSSSNEFSLPEDTLSEKSMGCDSNASTPMPSDALSFNAASSSSFHKDSLSSSRPQSASPFPRFGSSLSNSNVKYSLPVMDQHYANAISRRLREAQVSSALRGNGRSSSHHQSIVKPVSVQSTIISSKPATAQRALMVRSNDWERRKQVRKQLFTPRTPVSRRNLAACSSEAQNSVHLHHKLNNVIPVDA